MVSPNSNSGRTQPLPETFEVSDIILTARLNGRELCAITKAAIPCEKKLSAFIEVAGVFELIDSGGITHRHALGERKGWYHFSVRVHANLACQADCAITDNEQHNPSELKHGTGSGIRFQPFFLTGSKVSNGELRGKGLFARGFHFSGHVTPGNILLSCECDGCHRSFQIRSFHAGFSNCGYFYSASGRHTLVVSSEVPGCPVPLSEPEPTQLAALEQKLPLAPDGTKYAYLNPFRCRHCAVPYIDFKKHPEMRPGEYYGNYFPDDALIEYTYSSDRIPIP